MNISTHVRPALMAAAVLASWLAAPTHAWESAKVRYDSNGRLFYPADANGNRIPDYSHAGYKGGGVPLPVVPVVVTIAPVSGDDTANIQAAIDQVGALPVQSNGYRGTVRLTAGVYDVAGTVRVNKSGVVISGVGNGTDSSSNTIIRRTGTSTATVIVAGSGTDNDFRPEVAGTRRAITTPRVGVGSRSFNVDNASGFRVGDPIIILHPSTAAWITAMENGGVTDANIWQPGAIDIRYHRYITAISGNTIAIDAPVFNHLERSLSQSFIYKYDASSILKNVGVEKLLVDIVTAGPDSEDHAVDAITFVGAEDCWLRDATMQHFVHAGVQFTNSTRCTVERSRAIDPHSLITGERRYNFSTYHAQLILFRDSFASYSRHAFITNGTSTDSGSVVLDSTSDHNYTYAEAHRRWSTGLLFDRLSTSNRLSSDVYGFYNRGNYGTGHGWGAGHSVIWNTNADGGKILVQKPPTAQNYAIGSFGTITGAGPFAGPVGYTEGSNQAGLQPQSLYLEQVAQRQSGSASPDVTAPSAPTLSSPGNSNTSVDLAWTASSDDVAVDGYNIFRNGRFVGFASGRNFTVTGLTAATSYNFTVHAADVAGNLSEPSNSVTVTTGTSSQRPPIVLEAEDLAFTAVGANRSVANETFASGGQFPSNFKYVSFGADGTPPQGEYIDFVLPAIPAGTYMFSMRYKSHQANRGILQLALDGQPVGSPINQHSSPATFLETNFGVVRFASQGDHTIRLLVTGRDATATAYTITADVFTLRPDNNAPLINAPSSMTLEAAGPDGTVADYTGSATDDSDGDVPVTFVPPSGSLFPLGSTAVTADAEDSNGNIASVKFDVTIVDSTPPVLSLPANQSIDTNNPAGAIATFSASALDIVSGNVEVTLTPSSGTRFALGPTTVTATASDDVGNEATGSFLVTVLVSPWAAGVAYDAGNLALYQGSTWRTLQAHRSQSDWAPATAPALWVKASTSNQWDQPVQYTVGARVSYAGLLYQCLQAHISQAGWTPPATPALWQRISN